MKQYLKLGMLFPVTGESALIVVLVINWKLKLACELVLVSLTTTL